MKGKRQQEILRIIEEQDIDTQDQLLAELRARGLQSTQATISRDIKELHLIKELTGYGTYRYAVSERKASLNVASRLRTIFKEGVISFEDLERPVQDRAALPEDRAIARMDGEALCRCLAGMEERYANLLMLRFYHGFQNKEIAGLLGMSQTQVAMGIYRARQKLMQMMKGGTDQDGT